MRCRVKKGRMAFYGQGAAGRRLRSEEEFDFDGKECPEWAEPVEEEKPAGRRGRPPKEEEKDEEGKGHLGQTPVALSQRTSPPEKPYGQDVKR